MSTQIKNTYSKEFVTLMAILMSLVALSIDAILPALSNIGASLDVKNPNDTQLILSAIFLGMAFGLIIYGPLADSFGRKSTLYLGISIFLIGNLISLFATDFTWMLIGRVAQGFGAASCRVVTTAMIRDKFSGQQMGQVMSLIMMIFILVPALAPSVGQAILFIGDWRSIFIFVLFVALLCLIWLHFRQAETLKPENKREFSIPAISAAIKETITHPITRLYIFASGITFGAFVAYLSTAQQILQIQYETGDAFSLYFGCLALAIGTSSFVNSKLLKRHKMEKLSFYALLISSLVSILFTLYIFNLAEQPLLLHWVLYLTCIFFCIGILFGNLSTLALKPMGHIAGIATSVIASIQTFISVFVGAAIAYNYNNTVTPIVIGFLLCGVSGLLLVNKANRLEQLAEKIGN